MRIASNCIRRLLRPYNQPCRQHVMSSGLHSSSLISSDISGFKVEKVESIDDFDMQLVHFKHITSGARLLHLDRKDTHCAFGIAIPTIPQNDRGTPHVLEHLVLCGSKKYPCRDPFFKMLTRSVANFLNAMTFPQYTAFVFSTANCVDYTNLLNVYFDSVFNPLLNNLDFMQEAWRLLDLDADKKQSLMDWNEPDNVLVQGVVYNEMKGVQSDPSQLLYRQCVKSLFGYGDSGGIPTEIINLNIKDIRKFHEENYRIQNARFVTYGSVNLPVLLRYLNDLISAQCKDCPVTKSEQVDEEEKCIWPKPKPRPEETLEIECPKTDLSYDPERPFTVSQSFKVGRQEDNANEFLMSILELLIIGNESSPMYQHLIASGLASGFSSHSGYDSNTYDTCFHIGVQGVSNVAAVREAIDRAIKDIISSGFSQEDIDSALHKVELAALHVPGNFGAHISINIIGPWLYGRDVGGVLRVADRIKTFRSELKASPSMLTQKMKELFENNWSRKTIIMKPTSEYGKRMDDKEKSSASQKVMDIGLRGLAKMQTDIARMKAHQDKHSDSSCLPLLIVSDVSTPPGKNYEFKKTLSSYQTPVILFPQQTNNLVYLRHLSNLALSDDQIPYLPLFCAVFDRMGTSKLSYWELSRSLSTFCSGVDCYPSLNVHPLHSGKYELGAMFSSFCTKANVGRTMDAWADILSDFKSVLNSSSGMERLKILIREMAAESVTGLTSNGHVLATLRAKSNTNYSLTKMKEAMFGLQQIELLQQLRDDVGKCIQMLNSIYDMIVNSGLHRISIHHDTRQKNVDLSILDNWLSRLDVKESTKYCPTWQDCPDTLRKTLIGDEKPKSITEYYNIDAEVNFCATALQLNEEEMTVADRASLHVLTSLMTSEHLHPRIREKNGAYGASATLSSDGFFSISSYRDPRREKTIEDFIDIATEVVNSYNIDDITMRNAKLKTLQNIDLPQSASNIGLPLFLREITFEQYSAYRKTVIDLNAKQMLANAQKLLVNATISNCILGPNKKMT